MPHVKPTRVVAVDWSGARSGERRKIWLAEVCAGRVERLVDGWSREQVTEELVRIVQRAAAQGERVIVGLDFSFGFPVWYARMHGWSSGREVWRAWTAERVEHTLTEPEFPFWGRGQNRRKPAVLHEAGDTPPLRVTELSVGPRPFSVFQLVGAGAVGPGSLRGMATLRALSDAGACVWPFDHDDGGAGAVVLEIWPRLYAPKVVKSNPDARVVHVRGLLARSDSPRAFVKAVRSSDDAFDALVGALALWEAGSQLEALGAAANDDIRLEGCIWRPEG